MNTITPNDSKQPSDAITEAFSLRCGTAPSPSVLAACRSLADDARLLRIIRQAALEGRLLQYAQGDQFLRVVKLLTTDPRRRR